MYVAMGVYDDGVFVTMMDTAGQPMLFETTDDAWVFVDQVMMTPNHPRMMWLSKVKESTYADP